MDHHVNFDAHLVVDARMWLNHVATVTWTGQTAKNKLGLWFPQLLSVPF